MSHTVTSGFIRDNLSGFAKMLLQESLKETLRGLSISPFLEKYINNFTVLINSPPQIMLLSLNLHEDFINEEGITVSLMFSPQSPRIFRSKLVALKTNGLSAISNINELEPNVASLTRGHVMRHGLFNPIWNSGSFCDTSLV